MLIVVAGGTGTVGVEVVRRAAARGHDVRVLSRSTGADMRAATGLAEAVAGADVVVDVLGIPTLSTRTATAFFLQTTANLLAAERAAGVGHHLALSIVGVDRAPYGYYGAKWAQERAVDAGGVPWTIQRATQFHDFAAQMFARTGLGPIHPVSRMRTQPISLGEVAERLVDDAEAGPRGRVRDIAGPREEDLAEMIRAWARHTGRRAAMPRIAVPGAFGRAMRDGSVLPGPDADLGSVTFAQWLEAQPQG
ncbi:SDR family oxidoreductase [Microbacterium sp. 22242]|uniref:SDR family oxidoreductase n=1 Tax=Microbacterium sp. 22242 TaxID=3453896 RepID=UPI003F83553F